MADRALRLSLDINIWVSYLMGIQRGHTKGAIHTVIAIVEAMKVGDRPVQLIVSVEMLDTLDRILINAGFSNALVRSFTAKIVNLVRGGPELLDPYLLISGRDQLGMRDREDAGVLATAISARADLLLTDNLDDFRTNDCSLINTRTLRSHGRDRQLFSIFHERQDGVSLVVAHPIDAANWFLEGLAITPAAIRLKYQA